MNNVTYKGSDNSKTMLRDKAKIVPRIWRFLRESGHLKIFSENKR